MAKKKSVFESTGFKVFMKYTYGIGAAVVIGGALFKIMHWKGASFMLIAGMLTEVFVFAVSSFEPLHEDIDWSRVYPQLAEDSDADFGFDPETGEEMSPEEALAMAEDQMKEIEITPELFESLSGSLTGLKDNVSKLATLEDATVATNEYTENVKEASGNVEKLSQGYEESVNVISSHTSVVGDAMTALAGTVGSAAEDAREYHSQVQNVTKNLSSLNAVYEMELKDAEEHIKSLNRFYGSLGQAMENMMDVAGDTETYKNEVATLTKNIQQLNKVYGGMLSAMGAGNAGNTGGGEA